MDEIAVFATADTGRFFLACDRCRRVVPHYRVYGRIVKGQANGMCACGGTMFRPVHLAEWRAAWWVLVVGWLWRKTIRRDEEWDPRMPMAMAHVRAQVPE